MIKTARGPVLLLGARLLRLSWRVLETFNFDYELAEVFMIGFKRILCPTDLSEESLKVLPYACDLARVFDAELYFVYVANVQAPPAAEMGFETTFIEFVSALRKDAARRLDGVLSERVPADIRSRQIVAQGHAAEEILQTVKENAIGLVIIATHGLTGWRHMVFGSVAEKVVRLSEVPVLTVSARTPVTEPEKQLVEQLSR